MSYWKEQSQRVLQNVFSEAIRYQWSVQEFKKRSSAAYPFGPRENHPYQVYLKERRRFMAVFASTSWWNKEKGGTE